MPVKRESILRLFPSLTDVLRDPAVQRVFVDAPDRVFIERNGRIAPTDIRWEATELAQAVRALAGPMGASAAKGGFVVTKDGVRVSGYPVNAKGHKVALVFECGPRPGTDLAELVRRDAVSKPAAAFLTMALRAGVNIGVVGLPGLLRAQVLGALAEAMPFGARVAQIGALDPPLARADVVELTTAKTLIGEKTLDILFDAAAQMHMERLVVGAPGASSLTEIRHLAAREVPILTVLTGDTPEDAFLRFAARARTRDALGTEVDALVAASFDLLIGVGRGANGRIDWVDAVSVEGGRAVTERLFGRVDVAGPLLERDRATELWMRWENWVASPIGRVSRNIVSEGPQPLPIRPSQPGDGRGTVEIRPSDEARPFGEGRPSATNAPVSAPVSGSLIDDRPTQIDATIPDPAPKGRARSYSDILRSVEADDDERAQTVKHRSEDARPSKPLPRLRSPKSRNE